MDIFNKTKRSWIMSRIKSSDTKPEIKIRSIVHRLGFRFRKNKPGLSGSPDIVLSRHHKVIFVHGCFWHGHAKCKRASRPSSNRAFWRKKLDTNIARDKRNIRQLKQQGWKVLVIWECEIKNEKRILTKLHQFLNR
jgi:DNA mismatch endonuclease (patch repair protein)